MANVATQNPYLGFSNLFVTGNIAGSSHHWSVKPPISWSPFQHRECRQIMFRIACFFGEYVLFRRTNMSYCWLYIIYPTLSHHIPIKSPSTFSLVLVWYHLHPNCWGVNPNESLCHGQNMGEPMTKSILYHIHRAVYDSLIWLLMNHYYPNQIILILLSYSWRFDPMIIPLHMAHMTMAHIFAVNQSGEGWPEVPARVCWRAWFPRDDVHHQKRVDELMDYWYNMI